MKNSFEEPVFREVKSDPANSSGNYIRKEMARFVGKTKITIEEESHQGVKVILKKDEDESIKEIKFVCSCGQTKSILLNYTE